LFTFVGASRGHLCDSTAFFYSLVMVPLLIMTTWVFAVSSVACLQKYNLDVVQPVGNTGFLCVSNGASAEIRQVEVIKLGINV